MGLMLAISWLHPGLAVAGLAAGLIPLIIHLINRRRHRRVPWAAMTFLLTAARRRSRRMRLEQWLLFAVRVLAVVLLGAALARPYVTAARFFPVGQTHFHRVILLDNSGSMGATLADGCTTYDRARQIVAGTENSALSTQHSAPANRSLTVAARSLLDSFPQTDEVSVVSLGDPATAVIDYPSFDRRRIRDALTALPLTQRATDVAGGFSRALELLDKSSSAPQNRCVYVISDFAGSAWSGESRPSSMPEDRSPTVAARTLAKQVAERAALVLVPVGDAGPANLGVARLALASTVTAVQVPVRFTAEVVNYGLTEVRDSALLVRRDDRLERRIVLPILKPGPAETVSFSMVFDTPGSHTLHAELDAGRTDRLALDNDRWLALEVIEALKVLVVDGAPGKTRQTGQAGYLLTALHPWPGSQSAGFVSPKAVSDLELGGEALSDYQVVVLCNVERLEEDIWPRLRDYVEAGGGLLVFAGEAVNVDHYNRFGYVAGDGVLPGSLKPAEGKLDRSAPAPVELGFAPGDPAHPVMADFEGLPASGLFAARVRRRLPIVLADPGAEVVLRYTDQEAAIVIRGRGAGRCGFVTTTADMAWNNLPAKGDYVSLMMNLVAYLAQPQDRHRNVEVGQPIVRRLTAEESALPLRVRLPSGEATDAAASVIAGGMELRYAAPERAGLYTVLVGGTAQAFAVTPPPPESDLKTLDQAALTRTLDAPFAYVTDAQELLARASAAGTRELGRAIVYAVLALLLCETWLAMRHAHPRDERRRSVTRI